MKLGTVHFYGKVNQSKNIKYFFEIVHHSIKWNEILWLVIVFNDFLNKPTNLQKIIDSYETLYFLFK